MLANSTALTPSGSQHIGDGQYPDVGKDTVHGCIVEKIMMGLRWSHVLEVCKSRARQVATVALDTPCWRGVKGEHNRRQK